MNRWVGCGLFSALALAVSGCGDAKSNEPTGLVSKPGEISPLRALGRPPKLAIESNTHDFGMMDQQQTRSHVFQLKNEGPGELVVRFANTTCGCTSVKLGDVEWGNPKEDSPPMVPVNVPAGGSVPVELKWDTEFRSGEFRTTAKLDTNDPEHPTIELAVHGSIVPHVEMTEHQINFTEARTSQPTIAIMHVYSRKLDDLQITKVDSTNPLITAVFEPDSADFLTGMEAISGLKGMVTVQPGMPIGPFNATLTLHTNYEGRPELTLAVSGQAVGDVILTPEDRIDFKLVKVSEGATQNRFIKILGDDPVQASVAKVEPDFLKVTLQQLSGGKNRYKLQVVVPPNLPPSSAAFRGVIELETDHPTAKQVRIPVRGQLTR